MTDPSEASRKKAAPGVRRRLWLAWAALACERLGAGLWLPLTLAGFFAALAFTDVLPSLPAWLHLAVVAAAAAGTGYAAWRGLADFSWPSRGDARRALETRSPVAHRPLTAAEDTLAPGATAAQASLWRLHQERARAALAGLRAPAPAPGIARRDPFALRAAMLLGLTVAAIGGGGELAGRLLHALSPPFGATATEASVKVWVTPPEYTGRAPLYLEDGGPAAIDVPEGSTILATVTGRRGTVTLALDGAAYPFEALADSSQRIEMKAMPAKRLEVRGRFRALAGWDTRWIADQPPRIAFAAAPSEAGRWRLRIDYKAEDDYGLKSVTARITRAGRGARPEAPGDVLEVPLSLPPFGPATAEHASFSDLTPHPWAGLAVDIQLVATDAAGHTGVSDTVGAVLPERVFSHPVAQDLAAFRKALLLNVRTAQPVAYEGVSRILRAPGSFGGDPVVHLALSTAKYRLAYTRGPAAAEAVQDLLWQAAVRIEDGNLAVAERNLDDAERALQEAMERGAASEEIGRLISQLERALAEYTRELAQRMDGQPAMPMAFNADAQAISPGDIARMMEELRQLSSMGAEDAARQMMAELQRMLQAMRNAAAGPQTPEMQAAQQMLQDMRALSEAQAALLDESFEQLRQDVLRGRRDISPEDAARADDAARRQQDLRQQLGEIMNRMNAMAGDVPESMGEAQEAMSFAEEALRQMAWKAGADAQGEALAKLEAGTQQAAQQMMQAMMERGMTGFMSMPGQGRFDPMARELGPDDGEQVEIPTGPETEGMAQRVRAILEEIRRRAADRTRPAEEQDYLRRLMRPY